MNIPGKIELQIKMKRIYRVNFVVSLIVLATSLLVEGCSPFYDDLSDCNEVTLEYRYVPVEEDEYPQYVQSMRHFLFDHQGQFIKELPQNASSPQELHIRGMRQGMYTVVTIGNCTEENTTLSSLVAMKSSYQDFLLHLKKRTETGEAYANAEELFWNTKNFEVKQSEKQHYICDLSNIHCHLIYQVQWQSVPPSDGVYRIELSNLTEEYQLDPNKSPLSIMVNQPLGVLHTFPLHSEKTCPIFQDITLLNHQLTGELISLRYRNDRIPFFQVKLGDKAITKKLNLAKAFQTFGWKPDQRAVQVYRIQIRINDEGSVTIRPWYTGSVEDWELGGTITL